MAGIVVPNVQFFNGATGGSTSACDAITDWVTAPVRETEFYVQGTASNSIKVSAATVTSVFTVSGTYNLTNQMCYFWVATFLIFIVATKAAGGLQFRLEDSSGRVRTWNIAGRDTWGGQWTPFAVHANYGWTSQTTGFDVSLVKKVGITWVTTASARVSPNCFWDAFRYGTGLGIRSGTDVSPAVFDDFITDENANKYGVIERVNGILMAQGQLVIGSTTGGEATYFKDTSETVVFKTPTVDIPENFYKIAIQGNASAQTKVYFGNEIGGSGLQGCAFKIAGSAKYNVELNAANITELGIYGCTFADAYSVVLPAGSVTKAMLNTSVETSAEVQASTLTIEGCNIIASAARGLRLSSTSHGVTRTNFIGCQVALHIDTAGTYDLTDVNFYGNTYDIENSSTGLVTINYVGDSAPVLGKVLNSNGGTTSIVQPGGSLTLTGVKDGSEVRIYAAGTGTELYGIEEKQGTNPVYSFAVPQTVDIVVHHLSYQYWRLEGYALSASDATLPVSQVLDRNYENP